jgi:chloride channel protein, CIC family
MNAASGEVRKGLVALALLSLLVGGATGAVAALFRLALDRADRLRDALVAWGHGYDAAGLLLVVAATGACTAAAAFLVRRFSPEASGSGIPHVEAVVKGDVGPASIVLLPVKFLGGLLAIGAGLALGREGPSVQMGASIAHALGTGFRFTAADCRLLVAAGAGAGLATAFNAPIAGAVFVLEELVRRFDTRTTIATLGASTGAIAVARPILGQAPEFSVEPLPFMSFGALPLYLALGVIAGVVGTLYCRAIVGTLAAMRRLGRWPVELRAGIVGATVGAIAWFAPGLVGGGDLLTQQTLAGGAAFGVLLLAMFLFRFALGAVSYGAGTPGGLFAPMLVLGAQVGVLFGQPCAAWLPDLAPEPTALAVVGMSAFFTAVVRAPVTGIVLVLELTGAVTLLLPLLGASFAAMAAATLLGVPPIYDSLRWRASGPRA